MALVKNLRELPLNKMTRAEVKDTIDDTFDKLVDNVHSKKAKDMFLTRMGGVTGTFIIHKRDFLECHVTSNTVHLFYCFGEKAGSVAEPIDLFPSDTLVAQFRLLLAE